MSSQARRPPAYQEYASDMLARFEYRTLTLSQRGLLYSMRLECWVNKFLPDSPDVLARILGFEPAEIAAELPYVMPFFECIDGRIVSPELEGYRAQLAEHKQRQSDAAKATNAKRWGAKTRANAGVSGSVGKRLGERVGERVDNRVGERIASGSLLSREEMRPSQGADELTTTSVVGDLEGWSDFTADPEEDRGAE